MPPDIRLATPDDIPRLVDLLLLDAAERRAEDPILWKIAGDAPDQIAKALTFALTAEEQPFRQFWQVSEEGGKMTGVIHSMRLPVPPIYAGAQGAPGLILPDSFASPDAPDGTAGTLVDAAEKILRDAGAKIILSTFVTGADWRDAFRRRRHEPLTLYLARSGPRAQARPAGIRAATQADVPGIVTLSADNRQILREIDPFWETHPEADARFSGWMARSLSLRDRDMLVMGSPDDLEGYVIAQPASRLHFPPAHDTTGTGVIDDYYHPDFGDPRTLADNGAGATALLRAAETAFEDRGMRAAFVVCPAGWGSKIEMLKAAGYETAMTWSIKR